MPKVVGMYKESRSSLKSNLGGWFEKKKPEPVVPAPEPAPEPAPISDVGKEARSAIDKRKKALAEAMKP